MLSRADIQSLWELGGAFGEVAAHEMLEQFDTCFDLFFDAMLRASEPSPLGMMALARFPFLGEGYAEPECGDRADCRLFGELEDERSAFLACCDHWMASHRESAQELLRLLEHEFPGIRADLRQRAAGLGEPSPLVQNSPRRQLMVFVTGWCNLHCPYCFSNDIARREISLGDLDHIFRWAKSEGVDSITPCGGEPLMYRHLPEFLRRVSEEGMTTYFASNFTIDCSTLEDFKPEVVRAIYLHLADESLRNPRLRAVLLRNIELAKSRRIELVGRANITSTNYEEVSRWFEFLKQTGIRRLHVALTIPSSEATNRYVDIGRFEAFVPLIERLVREAECEQIALGFAKPLPLCLFSEEVARKLLHPGYGACLCNIYDDNYMHNICLSPEMTFTPCLGLTEPKVAFDEGLSWEQIGERFRPVVSDLLRAPLRAECRECALYVRRLCQGACLSYKTRMHDE